MSVSLAGVIGACVGLYVGWLDYKILKGLLQASETANRQAGGDGGRPARYGTLLRGLFFGVSMIGCPVVGYWAASQLAG